jgi:ribosomal protein L37AE/L43A
MSMYKEYKRVFPNKTDEQIIEMLGNEVRNKTEEIHRLLSLVRIDPINCPKCNSENITKSNTRKWCDDCGNVF